MTKVGRNDPCPCGSGKKFKKCHGNSVASASGTANPIPKQVQLRRQSGNIPWGIPGEEHKLVVVPLMQGQTPESLPEGMGGLPGKYKVQILLSRPGYPIAGEREYKFIDELIGDSHISIAKPRSERRPEDVAKLMLDMFGNGTAIRFMGLPNDQGYLGKLVIEDLFAENWYDAESKAYETLAPFLSTWSLHLDIPVNVETIQVTDLQTHASTLRVRTPQFNMSTPAGMSPGLGEDFRQYASIYREGMDTNSPSYRFLCLYKIIESISSRRSRIAQEDKKTGRPVRRFLEQVPKDKMDLIKLLNEIYPWRTDWDDFALNQMIPPEAAGSKIGTVRERYLNPLRTGIAHALLKSGEIKIILDRMDHIQLVNKWLPLTRVIARLMLKNEFPEEFELKMNPNIVFRGPAH